MLLLSCLTFCGLMDCSLPGFSVHGILQARILEWVAIHSFRGSSDPGIEPRFSALKVDSFSLMSPGKPCVCRVLGPYQISQINRESWASFVTQLVKNLPAKWETWVQSLGWEDPLEKGTATHSHILAWRIPWTV